MSIPTNIIAGDHYEFTESYPAYPATDGWGATLYLAGNNPKSVVANSDGSSFKFILTSAVTALWSPDLYRAFIRVAKAGVKVTMDEATIRVSMDPASALPGTDIRTHARRTLDSIMAVMENRATKEHESAMVGPPGGVQSQVSLLSPVDLVYWYNVYSNLVLQEEEAEQLNKGRPGKRFFTRFDAVP